MLNTLPSLDPLLRARSGQMTLRLRQFGRVMRHVWPQSILLVLLFGTVVAHAQDAPQYTIRFGAQSQNLSVRLCLAQAHTRVVFDADSSWAMRFVHDLRRDSGQAIGTNEDDWTAANWRAGECLAYRADLDAIAATHRRDVGWRLGDDLVTAPQLWLLRPNVQGDADARVRVFMPPGWTISVPWLQATSPPRAAVGKVAQSSKLSVEQSVPSPATAKINQHPSARAPAQDTSRWFVIANTPSDWSATVAFGHFTEERIELPGGTLRLSILYGADAGQQEKLRTWLRQVSRAILTAYGSLPVADVQVLMIPASTHSRAVIFGQHTRGEGNALHLLINPTRPLSEFMHDWIAVHELSHLMHPYLGDSGSWLAEGLATYFQNVLRARAGLISVQQAWEELADGFTRGQRMTGTDTLVGAARNMHQSHAYARIYWAGAAYWLTVDSDLRRNSGGKLDIDIALSRLRNCCLHDYRRWKPDDFVARLDTLLGVHTFSTRYRQFSAMRKFPDWQNLFKNLGIREVDGHVTYDNAARDAKVRDAIMAAPHAAMDAQKMRRKLRRRDGGK